MSQKKWGVSDASTRDVGVKPCSPARPGDQPRTTRYAVTKVWRHEMRSEAASVFERESYLNGRVERDYLSRLGLERHDAEQGGV